MALCHADAGRFTPVESPKVETHASTHSGRRVALDDLSPSVAVAFSCSKWCRAAPLSLAVSADSQGDTGSAEAFRLVMAPARLHDSQYVEHGR